MPIYTVTVIGPTGPVATEQIEAPDAGRAGQLALELAEQILNFGHGVARRVRWRVQVSDALGELLAELPIGR
ncbi:MAG: hypothetical protein U1E62_05555 [Alsobacter sp.]